MLARFLFSPVIVVSLYHCAAAQQVVGIIRSTYCQNFADPDVNHAFSPVLGVWADCAGMESELEGDVTEWPDGSITTLLHFHAWNHVIWAGDIIYRFVPPGETDILTGFRPAEYRVSTDEFTLGPLSVKRGEPFQPTGLVQVTGRWTLTATAGPDGDESDSGTFALPLMIRGESPAEPDFQHALLVRKDVYGFPTQLLYTSLILGVSDPPAITWKAGECDVNISGSCDVGDLYNVAIWISRGELRADVNSDGAVNRSDFAYLAYDLLGLIAGDANLDGRFSSSDLIQVFQSGAYEQARSVGWWDGDWTGDQRFDSSDLILAFQSGAYEQPTAALPVPEPQTFLLLVVACIMAWHRARRNTRLCHRRRSA